MATLFAFLGNPGKQYEYTRHNIGRLLAEPFLEVLAGSGKQKGWQTKFNGRYLQIAGEPEPIILLQPDTMMNRSGESVQKAASFFRVPAGRIVAVHDDLELPFGTTRLTRSSGSAGHNGIRSIQKHLGGKEIYRYRMGISRPKHGSVSSYVLGKFSPSERNELDDYLSRAAGELAEKIPEISRG